MTAARLGPAGLYVHVPFCERACPYCDFDFEVAAPPKKGAGGGALDAQVLAWLAGLEVERRERWTEDDLHRRTIDTVYVGGGTPSAVGVAGLEALFAWLREGWGLDLASLAEVTVELNPEHVDAAMIACLAAAGVGRISLGVQSLESSGLRELGRVHRRAEALACLAQARAAGLRASADLMLGWRGHSSAGLRREIGDLLDAGADHLSIYALTVEEGTAWPGLVARGARELPDDDHQAELLLAAEDELSRRGWGHYEVASYARSGGEAVHNGKYWRWQDVVALGPSAASVRHGVGRVERRINPRGLSAWLGREPVQRETLERESAAAEGLWLGLRRLGGIEVEAYLRAFAVSQTWLEARVGRQVELGNLVWGAGRSRLAVAPERWLVHDSIAVDLL